MTVHAASKKQTIVAFLLLFEYTLLPKFQLIGSLKFVHLLLSVLMVCYLFNLRFSGLNGLRIYGNRDAKSVQSMIILIIIAGIMGELLGAFLIRDSSSDLIYDYLIIYASMFLAFSYGYTNPDFDKRLILALLYLNIAANLFVSFMGLSLPSAFRVIWSSYREAGVRNHGIIGNANSSMAVMNALLLCVVMLYKKEKLELKGLNILLIILLPIFTVIMINSRGEFLVTLFLEVYLIITYIMRQKDVRQTVIRMAVIILVVVVLLSVIGRIAGNNPRFASSIERLSSLQNLFEKQENGAENDSESVGRIFYRWDEFVARFWVSPIFGSGFERGSQEPFVKGMKLHNDIFIIGCSSGLVGIFALITILVKAFKLGGVCMLVPFAVTALSNTYVYSNACMIIYFLLLGCLFSLERRKKA